MDKAQIEELVARAQQGDQAALEALLAGSRPALLRLARKYCPSADAEDALQEVLSHAAAQVGALRVGAAFVGWSMKMLVRECFRLKRRAARWVGLLEQDVPAPSTVELLELANLLVSLQCTSREILIEREILGRSAAEAAAVLGISEESAKSRLRRARLELRAAAQGEAPPRQSGEAPPRPDSFNAAAP
jgi:RNA polymerase sigma factor (sigma-70 family)